MYTGSAMLVSGCVIALGLGFLAARSERSVYADEDRDWDAAKRMIVEGQQTFRFDTFGDEAFWGDTLKLHEAIKGVKFGGVGPGLSPRNALALGLKVDIDALLGNAGGRSMRGGDGTQIERGRMALSQMDLDDSATTLALLRANAVVGLTGFFHPSGELRSIGI